MIEQVRIIWGFDLEKSQAKRVKLIMGQHIENIPKFYSIKVCPAVKLIF